MAETMFTFSARTLVSLKAVVLIIMGSSGVHAAASGKQRDSPAHGSNFPEGISSLFSIVEYKGE